MLSLFYRISILTIIFIFSTSSFCIPQEKEEDKPDVYRATCRVNRGTGVVFAEDDKYFWVITAAHCVVDEFGHKLPVEVKFHFASKPKSIKAQNLWTCFQPKTTNDLAILKVAKLDLDDYPPPKPIPLAKKDYVPKIAERLVTCGCPKGVDPTRIEGFYNHQGHFSPSPYPGQSGSGVFTKDQKQIIGIIIWSDGTFVSIDKIYELTQW